MRNFLLTAVCTGATLAALPAGVVQAQTVHLIQPASGAIVRETVPFRFSPGDEPTGGYVVVKIDGNFRTARVLPESPRDPVYLWDTKAEGANAVTDGSHSIELDLYDSKSNAVGSATVQVQVANEISPPSQDLKLVYHWASQHRLVYHRLSDMTVPGNQGAAAASATTSAVAPPPDQTLQSADLEFVRTTENTTATQALLRDIIIGGKVTDHGQEQTILSVYNVAPFRRTVSVRGDVLQGEETADFADHIGFPVPELPVRRVGKGDSWQADVVIPFNWDGTSAAHVTAECRLAGFEWQNNYPCAKIEETYSGPADFAAHASTASDHDVPSVNASAVTYNRTVYFAYNSGRLIKTETHTQVTMTPAQLNALGGTVPPNPNASPFGGGYPGGGYPGGGYPGGYGRRFEAPQFPGNPNYPGTDATPVNAVLDVNETTTLEAP